MTNRPEIPEARQMQPDDGPRVLLAYVSYPVTTAVYFERSLRRRHRVVTCGPKIDQSLITAWNLENMKLPVRDQDVPLDMSPDMGALLDRLDPTLYPDLYLWVESVPGYFPRNLDRLRCPRACYLIDTHLHPQWHIDWAKNFDFVFLAQREYIGDFRRAGIRSVHWLPLGCDPEIHRKSDLPKSYDVGFVGSLNSERRMGLLRAIEAAVPVSYRRCFWTEMAEFFSQCKVVFNNAVRNDLNMRVFEALSAGSFLLTDNPEKSGQEELFRAGEDLGIYTDDTIAEQVRYYLEHEAERERIAARGRQLVHTAHTYDHRIDELLNVSLGGQPRTSSAQELRERSLGGVTAPPAAQPAAARLSVSSSASDRSFVIPVLDLSPASPYNIGSLLRDLESIRGTVIVVFNSPEMAEQWKNHPRINHAVTMSRNVGVPRAWNVGLHMSETPVTFILNSDLHIEAEAVDVLTRSLSAIPGAAVVGPQGGFFHFPSAKDLLYFDKGSFTAPIRVDNVSGFLFAVDTRAFARHGIQFEDRYTPCYFEEWDIGLQCKRAGLSCHIVPTSGYAHEWSGSIRALREIKYLGKQESTHAILARNREAFWAKWRQIAQESTNPELLESHWVDYVLAILSAPGIRPKADDVQRLAREILRYFPDSEKAKRVMNGVGLPVRNVELV